MTEKFQQAFWPSSIDGIPNYKTGLQALQQALAYPTPNLQPRIQLELDQANLFRTDPYFQAEYDARAAFHRARAQALERIRFFVPDSLEGPWEDVWAFEHQAQSVLLARAAYRVGGRRLEAAYRKSVELAQQLRRQLEVKMVKVEYFDRMEDLERKRFESVKENLISVCDILNENLPELSQVYDCMKLVQETSRPEQRIQYIIEQYKTGPYYSKPILFEHNQRGSAPFQIFGVSLEESAEYTGSNIPPLIEKGLDCIEKSFNVDYKKVWSHVLTLQEIHTQSDRINHLDVTELSEAIRQLQPEVIVNMIQQYFIEMPECLLTFDLYEPIKTLYQQKDQQARLAGISQLLSHLPSTHHDTLKIFVNHLFKTFRQKPKELEPILTRFGKVLTRPHRHSAKTLYDHHPHRFLKDLILNPILFRIRLPTLPRALTPPVDRLPHLHSALLEEDVRQDKRTSQVSDDLEWISEEETLVMLRPRSNTLGTLDQVDLN